MSQNYSSPRVLLATLLSAAAFITQTSSAQVTWSGGGADANWSTPANWAGVAPIDADPLIFAGSTQLVNTNDITFTTNTWLRFDSGNFNLWGNPLLPGASITNAV